MLNQLLNITIITVRQIATIPTLFRDLAKYSSTRTRLLEEKSVG